MTLRIVAGDAGTHGADLEGVQRDADPERIESAVELRHRDALVRARGGEVHRWLAYDEDRAVGAAVLRPILESSAGDLAADVLVAPAHRGKGVGSALAQAVETTVNRSEHPALFAHVVRRADDDTAAAGLRFALDRGFEPVTTEYESAVRPGPVQPPDASLPAGFEETTIARERRARPDWERRLHALYVALDGDVPETFEFGWYDVEAFRAMALEHPGFLPEGFFIVRHGSEYVGLTELRRRPAYPARLAQELTGVAAPYRGRGIATALKQVALGWAGANGFTEIVTYNAGDNPAMLAVNRKLGFTVTGVITVLRRIPR